MQQAIDETNRRRTIQMEFTKMALPQTVIKISRSLACGLAEGQLEVDETSLDKLKELGINSKNN